MNFQSKKIGAIAAGVALAVSAIAAQAEQQPTLQTAGPAVAAVLSGGATSNGGASYLTMLPASDMVDVLGTINVAPGDVGKTGSLIAVASVPGIGLFSRISGGIWLPLDLENLATLYAFKTKKLEAKEQFAILEDLVGEDTNLTGMQFDIFFGYITEGNLATLTFTGTPISFSIANPPSGNCPAPSTRVAGEFRGKPICQIDATNRILADTHLTADNAYFLNGAVFVGTQTPTANENKITLTIDAGTILFAANSTKSFLTIDRSARIMANGTPEAPIIMTSEVDDGSGEIDALNLRGQWGGLIMNGRAQLNTASGFDTGEGGTGQYGGGLTPVNSDDSGSLTYLQIRFAGDIITEDDELNSLALQGVGNQTNIDFIHIHNGADDGIEFYGGAVNAKHLLLTGNDDDAIDWTTGWSGSLQHAIVKMTTSGDNCIEADNLGSGPTNLPRSIPTLSNLTCIGDADGMKAPGHAFELKAGTGMKLYNAVIGGDFPQGGEGCIRISDAATFSQSTATIPTLNGTLAMQTSLITPECAADLQVGGGALWTTTAWYAAQTDSSSGMVDLGGPSGWANGWNINSIMPDIPANTFFDEVDYIGAVKDDTSDWTRGWTYNYENAD